MGLLLLLLLVLLLLLLVMLLHLLLMLLQLLLLVLQELLTLQTGEHAGGNAWTSETLANKSWQVAGQIAWVADQTVLLHLLLLELLLLELLLLQVLLLLFRRGGGGSSGSGSAHQRSRARHWGERLAGRENKAGPGRLGKQATLKKLQVRTA
jgi:hypothetical protein